jgi:hypothetical protein
MVKLYFVSLAIRQVAEAGTAASRKAAPATADAVRGRVMVILLEGGARWPRALG